MFDTADVPLLQGSPAIDSCLTSSSAILIASRCTPLDRRPKPQPRRGTPSDGQAAGRSTRQETGGRPTPANHPCAQLARYGARPIPYVAGPRSELCEAGEIADVGRERIGAAPCGAEVDGAPARLRRCRSPRRHDATPQHGVGSCVAEASADVRSSGTPGREMRVKFSAALSMFRHSILRRVHAVQGLGCGRDSSDHLDQLVV